VYKTLKLFALDNTDMLIKLNLFISWPVRESYIYSYDPPLWEESAGFNDGANGGNSPFLTIAMHAWKY